MTATIGTIPVHVYGRVSYTDNKTRPNRKEDKSLVIQRQEFDLACDTLVPELLGSKGVIAGSYADEGKSASRKKVKRPDYIRLLRDIENGVVKVLLILNTSRLLRMGHKEALRLHLMLDDYRVTLISIDDRKIISIDELRDAIEVLFNSDKDCDTARTIARNTLRGSLLSVSKGNAHSSYIPYGLAKLYTTERGEQIICPRGERVSKGEDWKVVFVPGDETEQEIVKWIFREYATKDISPFYIARQLNRHENPVVRIGPKGNGWCGESIRYILNNKHYNAKVFYGERCNGEHYRTTELTVDEAKRVTESKPLIRQTEQPPLIDDELFNKVQKKLEHNKLNRRKPQVREDSEGHCDGHCLTGVLFCQKCGRAMTVFNPKNTRYQCKTRHGDCCYWSVAENEMLPFLLKRIDNELLKQLQDKPDLPIMPKPKNNKSKIDDIDARIDALQLALKTAAIATIPALAKIIDELNEQRQALAVDGGEVAYHDRVQAAWDRWEALTEPLLVGIKTDTVGEDNPAVKHLGIQDEVDRLFNYTLARPSAIRQMLHDLEARVDLSFTRIGNGKRGKFAVDYGNLTVSIEGKPQTTVSSSVSLAERSVAEFLEIAVETVVRP